MDGIPLLRWQMPYCGVPLSMCKPGVAAFLPGIGAVVVDSAGLNSGQVGGVGGGHRTNHLQARILLRSHVIKWRAIT